MSLTCVQQNNAILYNVMACLCYVFTMSFTCLYHVNSSLSALINSLSHRIVDCSSDVDDESNEKEDEEEYNFQCDEG